MRRPLLALSLALVAAAGPAQRPPDRPAPRRIVCLIPAVTEMLFAIGAGPQVVAVGTFDRDPPAVMALPRVGGLLDPDTERILALRPDLVVVYGSQQELRERLARAGIPMFVYEHGDLAGVTATMRALGASVGRARQADEAASRLEARLRAVAARVRGRPRPQTLVVIAREPHTLSNIYASGGYGFLHDVLQVAGGRNLFADVKRQSVQPSIEEILARRPDVIVELRGGDRAGSGDDLSPWRRLAAVPAVKNGRVFLLVGDEFVEAGPRLGEAAEKLSRVLQPEAWRP